ncbi:MAG: protein translocase subunit SecD [Oscillospiraceae bacterium]|nr:protein translocase subunit SecD [Oscillospiraceae bacterium]
MNLTKATSVMRFVLLVLVIGALLAFSIFGFYISDDKQLKGIFEEDTVRLGLDLAGGSSITYQAQPKGNKAVTASGMDGMLEVMRRRLDNAGFTEALVYLYGDDKLVVELPSVDDPTATAANLMQTAELEFRIHGQDKAALTGDDVASASWGYDPDQSKTGEVLYVVNLKLTGEGAKKFAEATKYCAANNLTLDIYVDGVAISTPTVKSEITGGDAVISGSFTADEAKSLASNIDAGKLAYTLKQISMESVSASLGSNALRISLIAGAIGLLLVVLFMSIYYRIPGVWASLALVCYMAIFFLVLAIGQFNLTLTGIAGIVLSIGMAVDANVVIFERMKEELVTGKSVRSAIKSGYKRALWAILDANITTIIACVVLYFFGTGTIRGFATTLGIGVVISLFTALVVTRALLYLGVGMGIGSTKAYKAGFGGKQDA